ncbi:MAG: tetratricopeptide repeat protein [Saprospiraceae bacterium]|nr:tetratricopeptide repeat protein [Saprospiraceae bacterium]
MSNLAYYNFSFSDLNEAITLSLEALEIQRLKLPFFNVNRGNSHNNIGIYYKDKGLYDLALRHLDTALEIRQELYKSDLNNINIAGVFRK